MTCKGQAFGEGARLYGAVGCNHVCTNYLVKGASNPHHRGNGKVIFGTHTPMAEGRVALSLERQWRASGSGSGSGLELSKPKTDISPE